MRHISSAARGGAVLACLLLISSAMAQAVRTNNLESLRTAYDSAAARIAADTQRQKDDALAQYGKNLDAVLKGLKQKGDIDGYAVVEQEAKRFATDKTILTNAPHAYVAPVIDAYQKHVQAADTDSTRRSAALLKQYVAALCRPSASGPRGASSSAT